MRGLLLFSCCLFLMVSSNPVFADIYQWEDDQGVIHFTDNADNIPLQYKKKVQQRESSPPQPPMNRPTEVQAPAAPIPVAADAEQVYGGQPAGWWKERFTALRQNLTAARSALAEKQEALQRAHRAYVVSMGSSQKEDAEGGKGFALNSIGMKRKAYRELQEEIPRLEERVREVEAEEAALLKEADAAGVPADAR